MQTESALITEDLRNYLMFYLIIQFEGELIYHCFPAELILGHFKKIAFGCVIVNAPYCY